MALSSPVPAPTLPPTGAGGFEGFKDVAQDIAETSRHLVAPNTQSYELPPLPEFIPWHPHEEAQAPHHSFSQPSEWAAPSYYPPAPHYEAGMHSAPIIDSHGSHPSSFAASNDFYGQRYPQYSHVQPGSSTFVAGGSRSPHMSVNPNDLEHRPSLNLKFDKSFIHSWPYTQEASRTTHQEPTAPFHGDHSNPWQGIPQADLSNFGPENPYAGSGISQASGFTGRNQADQHQLATNIVNLDGTPFYKTIQLPLRLEWEPSTAIQAELLEHFRVYNRLLPARFLDLAREIDLSSKEVLSDLTRVFRPKTHVYAYSLPSGQVLVMFNTRQSLMKGNSMSRETTVWTVNRDANGLYLSLRGVMGVGHHDINTLRQPEKDKAEYRFEFDDYRVDIRGNLELYSPEVGNSS